MLKISGSLNHFCCPSRLPLCNYMMYEFTDTFSRFDVPADCSVELSPLGYQFFTDIFEIFDKVRIDIFRVRLHLMDLGE